MANKVVTIVVDPESVAFGVIKTVVRAQSREIVSYTIEDENLPDRQVSPKWYVDNWGLSPQAARDASHSTPWYLHYQWTRKKALPDPIVQALERLETEHQQPVAAS